MEKAKSDILEDKEQYDTVLKTLKKNTFVRLDDEDVCITSDLKFNKGLLVFKIKHDDSKFLAYYGESKIKAVSSKEIMSFLWWFLEFDCFITNFRQNIMFFLL